jgi:hypothetical protein
MENNFVLKGHNSLALSRACSASPDSALLVAGKCSFTGSKLGLSDSSRLDSESAEQALLGVAIIMNPN